MMRVSTRPWRRVIEDAEMFFFCYYYYSSNENLSSSDKMKEFENPPVPPREKGHARASSLDFNQMFGSRAPRLDSGRTEHKCF